MRAGKLGIVYVYVGATEVEGGGGGFLGAGGKGGAPTWKRRGGVRRFFILRALRAVVACSHASVGDLAALRMRSEAVPDNGVATGAREGGRSQTWAVLWSSWMVLVVTWEDRLGGNHSTGPRAPVLVHVIAGRALIFGASRRPFICDK